MSIYRVCLVNEFETLDICHCQTFAEAKAEAKLLERRLKADNNPDEEFGIVIERV